VRNTPAETVGGHEEPMPLKYGERACRSSAVDWRFEPLPERGEIDLSSQAS